MQGALAGTRILDFSRALAGSYCALILADLGADVIRIEQVPPKAKEERLGVDTGWAPLFGADLLAIYGDKPTDPGEARQWARHVSYVQCLNRNKRSLSLDLKTKKGKEILCALVKKSDVVFDNYRPAVLKRMGLDFNTFKQVNPRIVSCSLTGFGSTGPWSNAPAYDAIVQALSGAMSMTGIPGGPPCRYGIPIGDLAGGMFAAITIMSALRVRDLTGEGQSADVSMLDAHISLLNYRVGIYSALGEVPGPVGSGQAGRGWSPYGAFECKDNTYLTIAAGHPNHWGRFVRAIGLPELEDDPQFNTNSKRAANIEVLTGLIEGMFLTKTAQEWEKVLFDAEVPVGVVNNVGQAVLHPQVLHRKMIVPIKQAHGETWRFAGNPIKVKGLKQRYKRAPALGEDTVQVLKTCLGYSKKAIKTLKEEGIVWEPD